LFNNVTGYASWTFNAVLGWLGQNNNQGDGPTIPVGTGFFLLRAGTGDWTRTFSVN
jgi:hypothetical protein